MNAVLHRSYSMAGDHIRVEIFPNRIEITNPGRFPGLADPTKPTEISRYARNPRIVRVCSDLGIARELGEGIKRIFAEMRSLGLADPIYTQTSGAVRLVLSSAEALPDDVRLSLSKGARRVLDVLRLEAQPLGTGQVAQLAGLARPTASRHLQALRELGIVAWEGQGPKTPERSLSGPAAARHPRAVRPAGIPGRSTGTRRTQITMTTSSTSVWVTTTSGAIISGTIAPENTVGRRTPQRARDAANCVAPAARSESHRADHPVSHRLSGRHGRVYSGATPSGIMSSVGDRWAAT